MRRRIALGAAVLVACTPATHDVRVGPLAPPRPRPQSVAPEADVCTVDFSACDPLAPTGAPRHR